MLCRQARAGVSLIRRFKDRLRRNRTNVAFVSADMPPMFDKQAGALRLYNILRILDENGWRIVFASCLDAPSFANMAGSRGEKARYERSLRDIGVERISYGIKDSDRLLRSVRKDLTLAFLSFPAVAKQFIPRVRSHAPSATVIYDMVDFHAVRTQREAALKSDPAILTAASELLKVELAMARAADLTIVVSEAERKLLLQAEPGIVTETIPIVFDLPPSIPSDLSRRSDLLFVGGFLHAPNGDAVLWFAREIWPLIRKEAPQTSFLIAGNNMPSDVLALKAIPGIEIVGFVSDLTDYFDRSRVFVAPLRFGAGVSGKIVQSMAHGLPVVATTLTAEGLGLKNHEHALLADTPQAFAEAVLRLMTDDALWHQLQVRGRTLIETTQSMNCARHTIKTLLERVASHRT